MINRGRQAIVDLPFDGRSDYDGIPAGNFDTGADGLKTPEQAKLWGGTVGQPCDPKNINRDALALNGGVIGYVVGLYAQDEGGRNGVPARDDCTRHLLPEEE
jgi:Zn-dependent M28 family amino/carboxypeptidase